MNEKANMKLNFFFLSSRIVFVINGTEQIYFKFFFVENEVS